jgi:hypothetical protein
LSKLREAKYASLLDDQNRHTVHDRVLGIAAQAPEQVFRGAKPTATTGTVNPVAGDHRRSIGHIIRGKRHIL